MATVTRSRVLMVAAALVFLAEGGTVEAFVVPSGLSTQRNLLPGTGSGEEERNQLQQQHRRLVWKPLRSFQFIKGEISYGDISEGSSGLLGGPSLIGGNTLSRGQAIRRRGMASSRGSWWTSLSGFSRTTPTTLLAAGSLESWPVQEADDIQILVGADVESSSTRNSSSSSSSVRATLERWERDISLEVVGFENDGYPPMLGNEMQPNGQYSNGSGDGGMDRCTQSIKFDVADGDVYPFSGTISVPPPLTVEDSMGNKQTVMMVLNNPDENDDGDVLQFDEYGNQIPSPKPSAIEAKLEPVYKSPDEKYAEAQKQQQLQYDEFGNEIYNPHEQPGEQTISIPSNGYQSFQLDATDPATGKIKISLEREEGGGGGGFGSMFGGGDAGSSSEARVEIYHGFRDQYGNSYNNGYSDDEEDRRISFEVSTMHPTFSSVVDTMPTNLLAKHTLPSVNDLSSVEPYLEVRIVNTGGASLKAGVNSFLPQYKPQTRERRNYERQQYERRQQLLQQPSRQQLGPSIKADDPFLLVDSAQSTTSARRMNVNTNMGKKEPAYVRARSAFGSSGTGGPSINTMWSTGDPESMRSNGYGGPNGSGGGMKPNTPGADLGGRFVQADAINRSPVIQTRVNSAYWDAIDTTATPKRGGRTSGLVANNDFTKANGGATTAIIPGSRKNSAAGTGFRRVSPSGTSLQSFGGNSGDARGMQQPFQRGPSAAQSFGGSGLQEAFPDQTSPQRTRSLQPQRPSSVYAGNGNVIGNGVIAGRPASGTSAFRDDRSNNEYGSGRNGMQPRSNNGYASRPSASSSLTPQPSNTFGGGNSNILGNEAQSNNFMGSMKQRVEGSDAFSNNGYNQQQRSTNGGLLKNAFGGSNSNNQQMQPNGGNRNNNSFGGNSSVGNANNNSFGGNSSFGNTNNNAGRFGGSNNNNNFQNGGGSPFGNIGTPPQTKANSKNPFANLNGETRQQPMSGGFDNPTFSSSNSNGAFGGGGGGAPQRPLSPSPNAMKNPFAGLNGKKTGPGGSTTAMRSSNTVNGIGDYGSTNDENPIVGFAKNLVKGMSSYGSGNNNDDDGYYDDDGNYYR
eukprot:CAMPEP_0197174298 /NCGR_PEP_ID=MMETSP1423-20130617/878_1 /TAXON_ID=476441 /ORGANISM="Pseudo-nitzschia heimii, Strain UNC1101" /LENGTH=1073 /DNA_ID=CAMNT_0042623209 /DNA_START=270 /DNA_END=3491 /DNA_ORIENTATION=+